MSSTLARSMLQFYVAVLSWVYTKVCHLPTYSSTLLVIKLAEMLKQSSVTVGYYEDESGELQYNPLAVIPESAFAPAEALNPRALLQGTPAADLAGAAQGTPVVGPSVAPTGVPAAGSSGADQGTPAAAPLSPVSKRMAESERELAAAVTVCTRFNTPVVSLCFARPQPHIRKLFPTHIIYRNVEPQQISAKPSFLFKLTLQRPVDCPVIWPVICPVICVRGNTGCPGRPQKAQTGQQKRRRLCGHQ